MSKKYIAEFIGTLGLTLIVALAIGGGIYSLPVPLAAALFLMMMVYVIGGISGAHLNPAVSIALYANGKISKQEVWKYVGVQLLAGIVALFVSKFIHPFATPANTMVVWQSVAGEFLGAFFFLFGLSAVVYGKVSSGASGFVAGGSLLSGLIIAGLVGSLGILNPAVVFALGIFKLSYLLASVVGGICGVWVYKKLV